MNNKENEILSFLTRDVRTSLSSVLGFVETLYDSHQSTKEKFISLRRIKSIIEDTAKGLDDIENLMLHEKGWLSLRSTQFSLEEELSETLIFLQSLARKNELSLQIHVEGMIPTMILSDPLRMRQLITHLVHYFIRQLDQGTVRLIFSLIEGEKQWLKCDCDSTGTNITRECFEEAIQKEAKESAYSLSFAHGRAAMDLSLIQVLASSLGGYLEIAKSRLGRGNALSFYIDPGPMGSQTIKTDRINLRSLKETLGAKSITIPDFSNKSFLVVEDDKDIGDIMTHFLKRTGAQVEIARDGEEGYEKAAHTPYDLVFLDLQLPKLNGLEICTKLRDARNYTPIVALTANTTPTTRAKCKAAGFSLYLTKPISIESLFDIVPRVLM